jgi:hypothetical protein
MRRDQVEAILACREVGRCGWDVVQNIWYVSYDRTGRKVWERTAICLRGCGSTQRARQEPWMGGRRLSSKVKHPPEWYDYVGLMYDQARVRRLERQLAAGPMDTVIPLGFKGEKPREGQPAAVVAS